MRRFLFALALGLGAIGCISQGYTPMRLYSVHPSFAPVELEASSKILVLRDLMATGLYNERMAYLNPDGSMAFYGGAAWAEPPKEVTVRALRDAVAATRHFRAVVDSLPTANDTYVVVSGELRRFEELRGEKGSEALCEVRLEARMAGSNEPIFADVFSATTPMEGNGAAAYAAAMQKAVSKLADEVARKFASI